MLGCRTARFTFSHYHAFTLGAAEYNHSVLLVLRATEQTSGLTGRLSSVGTVERGGGGVVLDHIAAQ